MKAIAPIKVETLKKKKKKKKRIAPIEMTNKFSTKREREEI